MTVMVVALITTLRRRRSDSVEGSSTGTLSAASTVRFLNAAARGKAQRNNQRRQALNYTSHCARCLHHCGGAVVCCGVFLSVRCSDLRSFISSLRFGSTSLRNCPLIDRTYATSCCTCASGILWRNEGMPFG